MNLKHLNLTNLFKTSFLIIFLMVILLGFISWRQTNTLWHQTKNLYEHPIQVKKALSSLESDIIFNNLMIKNYLTAKNTIEKQKILQTIKETQTDIKQQLKILNKEYLGSKTDIKNLADNFSRWDVIMDDIIDLVRAGKTNEAKKITGLNGIEGKHVNQLLSSIHSVNSFSSNKADELFLTAKHKKSQLNIQLLILTLIILISILLINYLLNIFIKQPIVDFTNATQKFTEGDYNVRIDYSAKNELGTLAGSFNNMASVIQYQINMEKKVLKFNSSLFDREDFSFFFKEIIKSLVNATNSQIGAIYLLNEEGTEYILQESIGLSKNAKHRFSAKFKEGEFGLALINKTITLIKDIPDNTAFIFSATSGKIKPKEIIALPIISGEQVIAIISISSLSSYSPESLQLLKEVFPTLTARINGVLQFHKVKKMAKQLEEQNTELNFQDHELNTQAEELKRQNTELKMQKIELDEANRLKSTFISNMSHELRTPLNSVIALSSLLKRKLKNIVPEEEFSYINVIERNGKHLLELINEVLDISRIEAGRLKISSKKININNIIEEMADLIKPQAEEKNILLKINTDNTIPLISSDEDKIRHILQNLIGNAVKFTEKGEVEVSVSFKESKVYIQVKDTGIGIPPDQLPYIFDEFRQAESGTARKYGGTGLGLSIAKKYAEILGGNIKVQSTPGKGSVFTLILPVEIKGNMDNENEKVPVISEKISNNKSTITFEKSSGKKTILIVENSESTIMQLKNILQETGFNTLVAKNGKEALEQIAITTPDIIIFDIMIPGEDGIQFLNLIRANVDTRDLPVLVLTAKQIDLKKLKNLKNNHISQLVQKGKINSKQLLELINQMLQNKDFNSHKNTDIIVNYQKKIHTHRKKPLILIVEDNEDNLLTVKSFLQDQYEIAEARNGKEGIEKTKTLIPDLILLDIALPGMNGFRVFDAIKKEKEISHIPIIAVTASALTADQNEILNYGFDGYIPKPININKFEETIKNIFE